jgi:hypothetical protein
LVPQAPGWHAGTDEERRRKAENLDRRLRRPQKTSDMN